MDVPILCAKYFKSREICGLTYVDFKVCYIYLLVFKIEKLAVLKLIL